ncbi:nitrate reductase [NADPH] [Blastomyces gilchristii SLH14081]|uniref:Nitrate reductase n=2 Tax=Blastomyces gilchristii (strain SLH14081) TaxID=559298 RepID=A0A179U8L6_BLAGS|nr:nitrate reductase [NADPH] [Blastomyces gilchristii SLH14081]OAT04335.1 nitrate reductase [NADPH] [Blastomyces gilchristii SLH14081]
MESIIQLESSPINFTQKKNLVPLISQQPGHVEKGVPRTHYIPLPPPSKEPTQVLDIDKETPDKHVPRDPRLIRLTGVHPFNVEPPLTTLYEEGFLTSPELFYVRNHGYVPEVHQEDIPDWKLSIEGLVESPIVLNFTQILTEFEQITAPITLVCAGNRRKEQNQVRKSKGFSWGAAGVSTALFTGPLMSSILLKAKLLQSARYVCMEGVDKLPNGFYGTSVKLNWVMDPNKRIMLAHKMNGEPLRPDHGRPLRVIVPGQIGGRSVKWLTKLIISDIPSDNWYHLYDNRVLPTMISPEISTNEPKWWHDERYAIYDLNVNSAVVYPEHDETIVVSSSSMYNVKGYAYGGGGRRITRVEISLDKGKTWRLANIEYPEDKYREVDQYLYGGKIDMSWQETCFCWCFWALTISTTELKNSDAILVRAMDEALNIQPRDMYWSVLGMMNNPWFRVTITKTDGYLRFEHPTQPALIPGGWMERVKKNGGDLANRNWGAVLEGSENIAAMEAPKINLKKPDLDITISLERFKSHKTGPEPWFALEGEVYDGTTFLNEHPGGAQSILSAAGLDVTGEFMAIHSETAKGMMRDYHIGSLDISSQEALQNDIDVESLSPSREVFLDSKLWAPSSLSSKTVISPDSRLFTFKLTHDSQCLGLPVGKHVMLKISDPSTDETIIRAYTPVSKQTAVGTIDILIKLYAPTPDYPNGGKMTMAMDKLPLGAMVKFKGPVGKFEYLGKGAVLLNGEKRYVQSFHMICAGSGITPIFQVLRTVMEDTEDHTSCVVVDGNRTEADILCHAELDEFVAQDSNGRCRIVHTLTQPSATWTGRKGRISEDLLLEYVPVGRKRGVKSLVLVCGPEALEVAVKNVLLRMGWDKDDLVFF